MNELSLQRSLPAPLRMRATAAGFASVVVRSYLRIPQLLELLERLTSQDYPNFEIVVIEQSGELRSRYAERLARFRRDPRVRILHHPPLGAGRARIEAARQARGEFLVFMDDDDLPLGSDWLRLLLRNFDDPHCVAVSGRQVLVPGENGAVHTTDRNLRLCLRYSFLRMPRGRMRHTARLEGVTQVAGGNSAIRASAIARAGGWDGCDDHDEDSFAFRFARVRQAGEYFAFDPNAVAHRRLDIPGGMSRRTQSVAERIRAELRYSHGPVRRYHPVRFFLFYPCYIWLASRRSVHHVRESQPQRRLGSVLQEWLRSAPRAYAHTLLSLADSAPARKL
jgi:glycosyltransferase involved in cell wall biosynthesis